MSGGWLGLAASYEASINRGVRLASGATVVLALVMCYLFALGAGPLSRFARGRWTRGRLVDAQASGERPDGPRTPTGPTAGTGM